MNSCVTSVNVKMTTVRIPDSDMGTTSLMNAPKRLSPSTIAASSSSLGMVLKNPISSQVENGMVKMGYTRTTDQIVSWRPRIDTERESRVNERDSETWCV